MITAKWYWIGFSHSVVTDSVTPWTVTARLLCPWDSPGKNTGVVAMPSSRGSSRPQGLNQAVPHCRHTLYQPSYPRSPLPSSAQANPKRGKEFFLWWKIHFCRTLALLKYCFAARHSGFISWNKVLGLASQHRTIDTIFLCLEVGAFQNNMPKDKNRSLLFQWRLLLKIS